VDALDLLGPDVRLFGAPLDEAARVVVLLHGRDQDPGYVDEHVVRRIDDPSLGWVAPAAPGRTWYPVGFLSPLDHNQPALRHAELRLDRLGAQLGDLGFPPERIVWCGFSQGACLACHHLARTTRRWSGLVAFTGGLIGPPGTGFSLAIGAEAGAGAGGFGGMPAYFGTGDADPWVPEWRVRETAQAFAAAGAAVRLDVFPGRDHEICDAEIEALVALLARA
jgi:predicted esterase